MDYDIITEEGNVAGTGNGIQFEIWNKDKYYVPQVYKIQLITKNLDTNDTKAESECAKLQKGATTLSGKTQTTDYDIIEITTNSLLELTIPDAKLIPIVTGNIAEKEVFGSVTSSAATISRDSAFTAYFDVNNYDYSEYDPLALEFTQDLPLGTTIILLDKVAGTYYSYTVKAVIDTIVLDSFIKMGTIDTKFDFAASGSNMDLQFIVDFSDVPAMNVPNGGSITTSLVAAKKGAGLEVFDIENSLKTVLKDMATFGMNAAKNRLITNVNTIYNKSEGAASKWDNSLTALILKPTDLIPSDAYILCSGESTTSVYRNAEGDFVIPLGALDDGEMDLALVSSQFTSVSKTYSFDATWMMSASKAAIASKNGTVLADGVTVTLEGVKKAPISMKVTSNKKIYDREELAANQGIVNATISWKDLPLNLDLKVTLMYKNDNGNFVNTGWSQDIDYDSTYEAVNIGIPMANQSPGSYYLRVTVDEGLEKVAEVDYYFLLK